MKEMTYSEVRTVRTLLLSSAWRISLCCCPDQVSVYVGAPDSDNYDTRACHVGAGEAYNTFSFYYLPDCERGAV